MYLIKLTPTPIVVFVISTIASIINLTIDAPVWKGEVLLSAVWVITALHLFGPIISAITAIDGARLFNPDTPTVWYEKSLRSPLLIRYALTTFVCGYIPILVSYALMSTQFGASQTGVPSSALFVLTGGGLTLLFEILFGLVIGSYFGKVFGPFLSFALVFMMSLISLSYSFSILAVGGQNDTLLGFIVDPIMGLLQVIVLALISLVLFFALANKGQNPQKLGFIGSAICGLTIAITAVPSLDLAYFVPSKFYNDSLSCNDIQLETNNSTITLCTYLEHWHLHPQLQELWTDISNKAAELNIENFPNLITELHPTSKIETFPSDDSLTRSDNSLTRESYFTLHKGIRSGTTPPTQEWLLSEITIPHWCPALQNESEPPEALWNKAEEASISLNSAFTTKDKSKAADLADIANQLLADLRNCVE
ncbi:MAG: hypothetical protein SPG61_05360 [Arcanobacterium sp.]|nr:hypothetical protein [Arcanobacterium sp.]